MRFLFIVILLDIFLTSFSQSIGIGENVFVPDPSAGLDIQFTNKGILIPRIDLSSDNDATTIVNPAPGLLIYNTGVSGLPKGFYYNFGTTAAPQWTKFAEIRPNGSDMWLIGGNANTNPSLHFLGTTDLNDFAIRTNNVERLRISSSGMIGINTSTPGERLQIHNGNLLLSNNNNVAGKIIIATPSGSGNYVTSITTDNQTGDINYVLPTTLHPTRKQMDGILQVDNSGVLSWLDRKVFADFVVKTSNESVINSVALQDDDELFYTLAPNLQYLIEMVLFVNTPGATTQGIRVQVNMPAGATGMWTTEILRDNGAPRIFNTVITAFPHGASIVNVRIVRMTSIVSSGPTGGLLSLQWAQNAANANATIVLSGSYMKITQIN